jgi:RND family efflux transporter MFP subunit
MKHLKRKPLAIILIAIAALALGAAVYFHSKSAPVASTAGNSPKPALTVTTARPERARAPIRQAANGNITAWQEALIGSESGGLRLTEVRANVGDRVRAGQVLATFAPESIEAEVAQGRASTAEAEANALDAAGNADKARTLQASGALSEQQINQYITAEKTARARLEAARATLTVQQVRLRQTRLLAPDDGVISSRSATVGAVVGAGTELFRMIRGGRLEWRAEVTSSELGRLSVGTPASIVAANGVEVRGRVRMIAPTVDAQTRSALVYVDLPNPAGKLTPQASGAGALNAAVKAGMFARGEFDLGTSEALTVPQQSVVIRDGFSYVFLLGPDGHVSQAKVQIGRRLADRLEVLSGVAADAELVASGAGFLNDGDLVRKVAASAENRPTSESNRPAAQETRAQRAIK